MDASEIERFRRYLEVHREEAVRALNRLGEIPGPNDQDYAPPLAGGYATSLSKGAWVHLSKQRILLLHLIEAALTRMQEGKYGVCAVCGRPITPRRLDALPWTQYCLRCQQVRERRADTEDSAAGVPGRLRKAG
jgi:RNA polymerase-binding transcription factor DksA